MDAVEFALLLSDVTIAAMGSILVAVSLRTYLRNKSRSMLAMSIGFALIALGPLIEEIVLDIFGLQLIDAHIMMHFLITAGLLILVYSLYGARG